MIIAIDGPASSGKGEMSKRISEVLNIHSLDTGAIYRAVTYAILEKNFKYTEYDFKKQEDKKTLQDFLDEVKIKVEIDDRTKKQNVYLNGKDITEYLRTKDVTENVSFVSSIVPIRLFVNEIIREFAKENSVVMDGRDIGTYVFPNAEIKIYLTADLEERAKRRYRQNMKNGITNMSYEEVIENLKKRDYNDIHGKEIGALIKAKDAIEIDNTNLSIEETLEKILEIVKQKKR